jgi:hypothetical protein
LDFFSPQAQTLQGPADGRFAHRQFLFGGELLFELSESRVGLCGN